MCVSVHFVLRALLSLMCVLVHYVLCYLPRRCACAGTLHCSLCLMVSTCSAGGLYTVVANVAVGVSMVFYNSYLPLMVDDSEVTLLRYCPPRHRLAQ